MNTSASEQPDSSAEPLLHITTRAAWEASGERYADQSLETEGFIHCSLAENVLIPANERFTGQSDLVLLVIAAESLEANVVFEDCYDSGLAFPHVYGDIPRSAVKRVLDFPAGQDGMFSLPEALLG